MNQESRRGGWVGAALVASTACVLTVTILGSIGILGWRFYDRRQLQERVRTFVSSLQNRTPEELAERAESLKERPKVARYVLPEIQRAIVAAPSEQQQWSAIRIAEAFIEHTPIQDSLFELRASPLERIAAEATRVLSHIEPESRAVEKLGHCLNDAQCGAVRDEACAGLIRHGDAGLAEMKSRLDTLKVGRRLWLVRYVNEQGGSARSSWLQMLAGDNDKTVRDSAIAAMAQAGAPDALQKSTLAHSDSE
jgi:hypothetical protein